MSLAQIIDIVGIILLAAALPAAVVVAWRQRQLATGLVLSPLFGVFVCLLICHRFAVDQRYSAWRVLQWAGYMAVYLVAQVTPRRWIERAAAGVLSVASVVMLLEAFTSGGRVGGLLQGNPNIAAALIVQWSALAHEWVHCAAALLLIQTGSRGAAIAYITAWWGRCAQVLGVLRRWTRFRGARSVLAGSYVVLVLLMVAVRPATIQNRMATWTEAGRLFIARPLVGWGPGSYPVLAQADPGRPHADSLPMTVAAETGVVGLVAWGWLAAWAARAVVRSDDPARWGLVAFAVHNAVDYTLLWYWPGIAVVVALALVRRR